MKVTTVKEFTPCKISIRVKGNEFVIGYYKRIPHVVGQIDSVNEYCVHSENYSTLDEAVRRFNEVIKEIG